MNATVQAEWQLYDGTALETLYPDIYKGASDHRVFIFQVTPTSPETIHTWGLLHVARSTQLNLSDMQILDYLETGTLFGWKNVENGYYFLPAEMETFGFYYCGQDESGAWGRIILRRINLHRRRSVRSEECSKLGIYQRQIGGYAKPYRPDRNRLHCTCPLLQSSRIRPDTPIFLPN